MPTQPGGFCDLGPERDLRDATAILYSLKAAALVRADYPSANKQAREAISHYWQYPRIPPSHMVGGQYPEACLWTPKARERWESFPVNRKGLKVRPGASCNLRLEHLVPQSLLRSELLDQVDVLTPETLAKRLRTHHETALMIVVTREEDAVLDGSGFRSVTPDALQPWQRYAVLGLTQSDCAPIDTTGCKCASAQPLA
jgi:hypothetical protein